MELFWKILKQTFEDRHLAGFLSTARDEKILSNTLRVTVKFSDLETISVFSK